MNYLGNHHSSNLVNHHGGNPAGKAFAADFGVAEDGAVSPLHYESGFGMLAGHIGNKAQGGVQLGPVTIAGALRCPGDILHGARRIACHGHKHGIERGCHQTVRALLAEKPHPIAQRIDVQVTSVFQRVPPKQVDAIVRACAIAGDAQLGKLRMARTVCKPVVQIDLVGQILINRKIFGKQILVERDTPGIHEDGYGYPSRIRKTTNQFSTIKQFILGGIFLRQ